jgi:hypothetical protein
LLRFLLETRRRSLLILAQARRRSWGWSWSSDGLRSGRLGCFTEIPFIAVSEKLHGSLQSTADDRRSRGFVFL